ncbi:BMP family ABC transporter substrate-binding protein [Niveispirillum sp. KHB5.9]|uniref:BMP family ABC transporter substrate-binding protein n=1 Tax=Niveispirillum sp. KHB5.9 TaxID=3400269 RepID=UPI003A8BCDC7
MLRFLILILLFFCLAALPAQAREDYGVIYSGQKDDRVFNSLAVSALSRFEAENDVAFRPRVIVTQEDSATAIRAFVERGITTLVLVGFIHEQALRELAPLYPHARFTIIDGDVTGPNVRSIRFREQEAGFLAGMAAAYASRSGRVAFMGAVATPPVQRFGCGFIQGVREAGRPVQVTARYMTTDLDGFRDRRLARTVANEILADGADVLFPAAGLASRDALLIAAQAGKFGIGVDSDQEELAPGHIVTTALKRIDVAVTTALRELVDGTWAPGNHELGVAEQGVDWVRHGADRFLTAKQISAIEKAKGRIGAGRLKIALGDAACDRPGLNPMP